MQTVFQKLTETNCNDDWPLPLKVIPNYMGINLCSVEGMSWTEQDDGQLVSLTVHFLPAKEGQC